jgi:hypothetical protein
MGMKKVFSIIVALLFLSGSALAGDMLLEDINFPYDSASALDDLKQIPRIVDVFKKHPQLQLEISAHADYIGSDGYNKKLSLSRADNVKTIFVDQGIAPERIHVLALGKSQPKSADKTVDGRFINRRAAFSIYEMKNGNKFYYYKDNEMVHPIEGEAPLGLAGLEKLASSEDLDALKKQLEGLASADDVNALKDQVAGMEETLKQIERQQMFEENRGSLLVAGGVYDNKGTGLFDGKLFVAFNDRFAFQAGLAADITHQLLRNYQVDLGIVGNHDQFQAGVFTSLNFIRPDGYNDTASISQFTVAGSYLLDWGSVGIFYSKGLAREDTLQTTFATTDRVVITDTVLEVQDKFGLTADYYIENTLFVEAEAGAVNASDESFFGRLKIGYPLSFISDKLLIFAQGSYNNSLIHDSDDLAIVAGIEIGNWFHKKPAAEDIRPMIIPDTSFEMTTRERPVDQTP